MRDEKNCVGVSVIMPAYNAEKTIAKAIASVMAQTHSKLELIIIDDCSTDNTVRIARQYAQEDPRVRILLNEQNSGVAFSRNCGMKASQYPWIAFLDSDDVWHPNKLEKQLFAVMEANASLCYTSYALVDEKGNKVRPDYLVPVQTNFNLLLKENVIGCSTVLVSSEVIHTHYFQTNFYHEDYVLWLEILRAGYKAVGCSEVLTDWCYRENSRSYQKGKSLKSRWVIYRDYAHLPFSKRVYYLICYSIAGVRKYGRSGIWKKKTQ